MRYLAPLFVTLCGLYLLAAPMTAQLGNRPIAERLGYVPHPRVVRLAAADQKLSFSAYMVFRAMMYFGGLIEHAEHRLDLPVDYDAILQNMQAALELDPYNMDAYYFSQAVLAWDVRNVEKANALLIRGMEYRDWDFYLPLFVGFNAAYFLKDYEMAARYYQRAGELSDAELYKKLAARYLYESENTEHAITYMRVMIQGARNEDIRKSFQLRLEALEGIHSIESALEGYRHNGHKGPVSVEKLLSEGYLASIPQDPYGGKFFIDAQDRVRTTSKMAFGGRKQ